MRYTVRPLSDRTAFTGKHKPNPFRATWSNTLKVLGRELDALKAKDVVLELDVLESAIRLDGMLYANAKVGSPAVRIAFESSHGPLTYACDSYRGKWSDDPPDWQINVRAIALGLEALRAVDRYGITERGEQYAGFKALPAGRAMPSSHMTSEQAYDVLCEILGPEVVVHEDVPDADLVKKARIAAHPDKHDGDHELAYRVDQAAQVLGVAS